jgi:hypothetical protein
VYLNVTSLSIGKAIDLYTGINNGNVVITTGGNYIPTADTTVYYETFFGQFFPCSVKLGNPGINSTSWFSFPVTGPVTVTFWQAVDSETGFDWLSFYIDDVLQPGRISGPNNPAVWNQISASITLGTHTLKWVFNTDSGINPGRSAGWVTGVVIS